jgi:GPH family glycoside/pentoside/hexuronide:cation symporter
VNTAISKSLPTYKAVIYAGPAFALAVVGIPIYVYVPKFYSDVVGINIALMGYLLFSVRIFDAIIDPLIGYLSDRTQSRFGRRRPYIAIGSLFLAFSLLLLFNPPYASPSLETVWFGFSVFGLFFFWTLVTVPYEALGPEISFDYDERTRLFSLRDGLLLVGTLIAAASPAAITWLAGLNSDSQGERLKFFWISVAYAPLLVALCWICVIGLSELSADSSRGRPSGRDTGQMGFSGIARNRPFLILIMSYTIAAFGSNLPATLILYYVEYVLHSTRAELFLVIYFVVGVLFLPAWVAISKKIGKKTTWLIAMAINTVAFIFVFFLGPGDELPYGILVALSGIGFGATVAIPSAMQADVIDYDELLSGERREGQYVGLWSVSRKLAAALGVGAALLILGYAGYKPNAPQTPDVTFVLRALYALVPCICNGLGFFIALKYPISRRVHEEIRLAIAERSAGRPYSDPLGQPTV